MRRVLTVLLVAGLAACAHDFPRPKTIAEMHDLNDWQHQRGEKLYVALANDVSRIARRSGRAATLAQLGEAGYECQYGEAHQDYPEPMAVCTRSFATRACQMDWEVTLTSDPERADSVETTGVDFRRDCVGTAADWPEPVESAIDSQLAPPPALEPEPG
ncbi:hypothetical protein [Hyphomonas sp.]|jgi:hypothetical protein|uniref:hypothetical protein n=1 Tax=Hyphomonas sp. TaxID=87 RepID=UPI003918AACE